jgi:hypothetical protein
MDQTQTLLRKLGDKSSVDVLAGTFVSASLTTYTVDVGGGRIPAAALTDYLPEVNETVWVMFIDGTPYVLGPTVSKAGQGTVVSASGGLVTLTTAFGNVVVPYDSRLTPTAGQVMKLTWQGGGFAIAVMSANPSAPPAPVGPGSGVTTHVDVFTAVDSGSHQSSGWWTKQVYASNTNLSAWFYGTKISDTIPAAAAPSLIEVYISPAQIQGANPNFALHPHTSRPAGAPTLSSSTAVAVAAGWIALPLGFANALKAGGGSYGVGLNQGGYNIFRSLAQDGLSGALRITSVY